jgi:hypothetical protein
MVLRSRMVELYFHFPIHFHGIGLEFVNWSCHNGRRKTFTEIHCVRRIKVGFQGAVP